MIAHPSYYAWHPSFIMKGAISVFLTPAICQKGPETDRDFFLKILSLTKIDSPLMEWSVKPFMTNFYSGNEWQECWEVWLTLSPDLKKKAIPQFEHVPIEVVPSTELEPREYLPVRVLAEFATQDDALKCRDVLQQHNANAKWDGVFFDRFTIRDLGGVRAQLVVDVTTIERSNVQDAYPAASEAEAICKSHSGQTRFIR